MKKITKEPKIVICPSCDHIQEEPNIAIGDKFAWKCKSCDGVFEGEEPHLLQEEARFCHPHNGGGNVCTGFGGLSGEVHHKIIKNNR